jgi:hypothetical protein
MTEHHFKEPLCDLDLGKIGRIPMRLGDAFECLVTDAPALARIVGLPFADHNRHCAFPKEGMLIVACFVEEHPQSNAAVERTGMTLTPRHREVLART